MPAPTLARGPWVAAMKGASKNWHRVVGLEERLPREVRAPRFLKQVCSAGRWCSKRDGAFKGVRALEEGTALRKERVSSKPAAGERIFWGVFLALSGPRWTTGPSKMNSAHQDLPLDEVSMHFDFVRPTI